MKRRSIVITVLHVLFRVLGGAIGALIVLSGFFGRAGEPEEFGAFLVVFLGTCLGMMAAAGVQRRRGGNTGIGVLFASGVAGAVVVSIIGAVPTGTGQAVAWHVGYALSTGLYCGFGVALIVLAIRGRRYHDASDVRLQSGSAE